MSYVFRLHTNGELRPDWFRSAPYLQNEIEAIRDPEGGAGQFLPTAIPSPFARFDLVNTAFLNLSRTPELITHKQQQITKGSKEEEKLVSDALDVLELIYNADQFGEELKIIPWDPKPMIAEMESGISGNQLVAQALELFMRQDAKVYHFDRLQRMYLIVYKFQVVGCTSPLTLAAASGNELHDVQISIGGDYCLFDGDYEPLYKRDPEFQYYLYALQKSDRFITELKGLNDYLKKNKELLQKMNPDLYKKINRLTPENYELEFKESDTGIGGSVVEVCSIKLRKCNMGGIIDKVKASDFVLAPARNLSGDLPLVLQNGLNQTFLYVQSNWNRDQKVPYYDPLPLSERKLPGLTIHYPYLTVSDLLEPCLIGLPYVVDKNSYFDGNLTQEKQGEMNGYMIPLKPLFFNYFQASDLYNIHPDGKPWFSLNKQSSDSITAELRLPVKKDGHYITFSRIYTVHKKSVGAAIKPDEMNNNGIAIERAIGLSHFPVFRYPDPETVPPHYRLQLVDLDTTGMYKDDIPELTFLESNKSVEVVSTVVRGVKATHSFSSLYFCLEKNFEIITVRTRQGSGVLIPKWKPLHSDGTVFSFAIDFGTSNTHIEYINGNGGEPAPLEATKADEDMQIASLMDWTQSEGKTIPNNLKTIIEKELLPFEIGGQSDYRFPQRTVLTENNTKPLDESAHALANVNIAFVYERNDLHKHGIIRSNLKWKSNELHGDLRVRLFFEQLLLMIRNKILMAGGSVQQTRIIWSYPFSMQGGLKDKMEEMITNYYKKLFNTRYDKQLDTTRIDARVLALPESFGPYYYFKSKNLIPGSTTNRYAVAVDIGGGTSDVFVFRGQNPVLCSSFRFAANALYGGWFSNQQVSDNGMLRKYVPLFVKRLSGDSGNPILKSVLENMTEKQSAADVASFLFSLENNKKTKGSGLFNFNNMLQGDDDLRIVFLFLYTAILYHIAQLIKSDYIQKKEKPVIPGVFLFSGTGSKILQILTTNQTKLQQLAELVFCTVFEEKYGNHPMYVLYKPENLKAATAKGGIYSLAGNQGRIDFRTIQCVHHPVDLPEKPMIYSAASKPFFSSYNVALKEFADRFIAWNDVIPFSKELMISPESFDLFKAAIYTNIETAEDDFETMLSIDQIKPDSNQVIAETLFFYPVIRTLNSVWNPLAELKPISE